MLKKQQDAKTHNDGGERRQNYHNSCQYRSAYDPPVFHVYILLPATEKNERKALNEISVRDHLTYFLYFTRTLVDTAHTVKHVVKAFKNLHKSTV